MVKTYRIGAVGVLLDEYKKVILELKDVIDDVSNEELLEIAHPFA